MSARWMPNGICGRSRSSPIAFAAAGHGTIRLQELAMPFSIDSTTAALTASCMPKSSQLTISTRASVAKPSSSLDSRSTTAHSARLTGYRRRDAVPAPERRLRAKGVIGTTEVGTYPSHAVIRLAGARGSRRGRCQEIKDGPGCGRSGARRGIRLGRGRGDQHARGGVRARPTCVWSPCRCCQRAQDAGVRLALLEHSVPVEERAVLPRSEPSLPGTLRLVGDGSGCRR